MKEVKVSYADLNNAGDLLNKDLIEKLSDYKIIRSKVYDADMIAIGGALFGLQYSGGLRGLIQRGLKTVYGNKPLYIWGSGFLYGDRETPFYRNNLIVCALRGRKTLEKIEKLTRNSYKDAVLADAGLLVDILIDKKQQKKYKIGIIPHFSQQGEKQFCIEKNDPKYHLINIMDSPKSVAEEIASCEYIASSSLHGLIFADSLHVPSLRIVGKTELPGGEFKFEDYYSCYGVSDSPWRDNEKLPTESDIAAGSCVDFDLVDEKKDALLKCFPKIERN